MAASLWIGRRLARSTGGPMDDTSSRMASDLVVVIELLADRRVKLWQADGGPAPGVDDHVTVSHHVREATETILRNSGASAKTAVAVIALTAKRVRHGSNRGAVGVAGQSANVRKAGHVEVDQANVPEFT